jgi:hypothetical protein
MGEQRENENKNNTGIIPLKPDQQIILRQMGNPDRCKLLVFEDTSVCGLSYMQNNIHDGRKAIDF